MSHYPIPENEQKRLEKLHYYNILDSSPEAAFDDLTKLAASLLHVPIVLISLIDKDRQWIKSRVGIEAEQTTREDSFCQYTIMGQEIFEVENASEDERFMQNPYVLGDPEICFYAGAPLTDEEGLNMGALCAIDRKPKKLSGEEKETLNYIARTVIRLIQYRREKQEAERLSRVKDEFLSNMSHEIRTPLNAIIGFTDLLKSSPLNAEQKKHLQTVSIASQNLMVLINDILDISKLESGRINLEQRPLSLKEVARHIFELKAPAARAKKLKLISSIDHEIPDYVLADETRLVQILMNLIGNAIKFTHQGYIELRIFELSRDEEYTHLRFAVKDTGIGIDPAKHEQIFQRFEQAESSTTREYGGTGLGLNIVRMLVELYGGKVSLESTPGKGSEFSFEIALPLAESLQEILPKTEGALENVSLEGAKILLVEDNEHNQILAKTYLERHKALVEIAENGEVAVEKIRQKPYDIVLMDLQMPKMDGFMATQKIREELQLTLPIVACSAHSLVGERTKCLESGMNDYISKPYTEAILINTLKSFITSIAEQKNQTESTIADDFSFILKSLEAEEGADFLQAMLTVFNRRIPQDIAELQRAVADHDLAAIKTKSHMLAGSLSSLRFQKGWELAKKTEQAALAQQDQEALEGSKQLIDYLNAALAAV
jgi:signal transduction histidine kinase/CheY-like chemotaxis protein/HPt (histidine-containing phosphotransfer) domain-containing protein